MNLSVKPKTLLSSLWIFAMFNYLYADVMGLMDSRFLSQYLTGTVEGMQINERFLLMAAILMEIPIAMVLLSRILPEKSNRWANIIAGSIKSIVVSMTLFIGSPTPYYIFFSVIEIACTSYIVWYAWYWKTETQQTTQLSAI